MNNFFRVWVFINPLQDLKKNNMIFLIFLYYFNFDSTVADDVLIADIEEEEHSTDWIEGLAILLAVVGIFIIFVINQSCSKT